MNISRRQSALICAALLFLATQLVAKRVPHKPVSPLVVDGIRYAADGDGKDQYVVATDASNGQVLWRVKVFHNRIRFWIEEDNQWIYITDLKLGTNSLLVRDERPRCYTVDLATRRVRKFDCGSVFAP